MGVSALVRYGYSSFHMKGASWAMEFYTKTMASSGLLIAARLLYGGNVVDAMNVLLETSIYDGI